MTTEILSPNYLTPGGFVEVNLGVGPGTAAIGARDVVLVGPKLSTGSYVAGQLYEVARESDVSTGAAPGSPLHRAARRFLMGNRTTKLWVLPVAETSGGSPVAASLDLTVTATSITAAGWIDLFVCGEQCRYVFSTTDTADTIATALAALVNGKTHLPAVATNLAGVLTLTAKLKGASQNSTILARTAVKAGCGVSWSAASGYLGTTATGTDGSTTEAANLATALATLDADSTYYVGITEFDATAIGHMATHLAASAQAAVGLRKRGFVGINGTKSTASALAITRNYERLHIAAQDTSDHDAAELMAGVLAVYALEENVDPSWAPIGYRKTAFTLTACADQAKWFDGSDISDLIGDGVIPIASDRAGAYIADGVTTRSKDATGTYDDRRALWSERISEADALAARVVQTYVVRYQGLKLDDDETLSDGTLNTNQVYDRRVVKPSQVKDLIAEILTDASIAKEVKNLTGSVAGISVVRSSTNSQRLVCRFGFETIDHARQATFQLDEVSRG